MGRAALPTAAGPRGWSRHLPADVSASGPALPAEELTARQHAFGYGHEDLRYVINPTGRRRGRTPSGAWATTRRSRRSRVCRRPCSAYVRQRFAQVTNPAIDPLREEARDVARSCTWAGAARCSRNGLAAGCPARRASSSASEEWPRCAALGGPDLVTLSAVAEAAAGPEELRARARHARPGRGDIVCSAVPRSSSSAIAMRTRPGHRFPCCCAIGAVHQSLGAGASNGSAWGSWPEAGDAWDVHHFAALFGYGAEAVHPWLALQCLRDEQSSGEKYRGARRKGTAQDPSKMGISTLQSYSGAQIFEATSASAPKSSNRCFTGTASVIGGIGFRRSPKTCCSGTESAWRSARSRPRALSPRRRGSRLVAAAGALRYRMATTRLSPTVLARARTGRSARSCSGSPEMPVPLDEVEPAEEHPSPLHLQRDVARRACRPRRTRRSRSR